MFEAVFTLTPSNILGCFAGEKLGSSYFLVWASTLFSLVSIPQLVETGCLS